MKEFKLSSKVFMIYDRALSFDEFAAVVLHDPLQLGYSIGADTYGDCPKFKFAEEKISTSI